MFCPMIRKVKAKDIGRKPTNKTRISDENYIIFQRLNNPTLNST